MCNYTIQQRLLCSHLILTDLSPCVDGIFNTTTSSIPASQSPHNTQTVFLLTCYNNNINTHCITKHNNAEHQSYGNGRSLDWPGPCAICLREQISFVLDQDRCFVAPQRATQLWEPFDPLAKTMDSPELSPTRSSLPAPAVQPPTAFTRNSAFTFHSLEVASLSTSPASPTHANDTSTTSYNYALVLTDSQIQVYRSDATLGNSAKVDVRKPVPRRGGWEGTRLAVLSSVVEGLGF